MPTTADEWRKLQSDEDAEGEKLTRAAAQAVGATIEPTEIAGVPCFRVTPRELPTENEHRLIFHVHGGAFVFNAGIAAVGEAVLLADACKMPALSVDYRMPPDHPFPAAADDVLAVWKAVLADHDPDKIAMAGTSAGAGLIMTTMLRVKVLNLPRPAAAFLGTPAADLSKTGDSIYLNAEIDNALGRYEGRMEACVKLYAAGRDLKEPLQSPVYGDLSEFPPTILISGTRDLLLSATVRTHRKLRSAGVAAELHVYEGMSHAAYLVSFPAPESRDALGEIARFFDRHLRRKQ
jgi:acetyl esterase/lipase